MTSHSIGSSPQGDFIDGSTTLHQAKRAACDRCRGQKLKCVREDHIGNLSSEKCIRCITASATCSFSVSKRAGRPPASGATSSGERRGKGKANPGGLNSTRAMVDKSGQTSLGERPTVDRFEGQLRRTVASGEVEVESARATPADGLVARPLNSSTMRESSNIPNEESLAFSTYPGSLTANLPWANDSITAFYDGGDPTNLEHFDPEYSWTFPQDQTQSIEFEVPDTLSTKKDGHVPGMTLNEDNTVPAHLRRSNAHLSDSPRVTIGHAIGIGSAHSFDSVKTLDSQGGSRDGEREESTSFGIFTPKSVSSKDFTEKTGLFFEKSLSVDEVQHRRMQELSELGMNLYSQLMANNAQQQQGISGSLGLQDHFVGSVIRSSAAFLALLSSFYPTNRSPTRHSAFTSSDGDGSASEASEFGDFATDGRSKSHHRKRTGASSVSKDDSKPLPADMMTIFQLLTCYIRTIHLHSILYKRLYDHLTALPRKDAPLPPVFPGMQVGGMSLDDFGNFQVKLLLQISTHMLGEIEMTLGLPDGYRVSKKNPQNQGILETSVSIEFIEMTMREHGRTGLGIERDRVTSIRDNLVSLRRLLKGTINI